MKVEIKNGGEVIWARDSNSLEGIASRGYLKDGTQQKIITALEDALSQAKGELLCSDDADAMTNIGTSAA
ncbi:Rrf2 family transcriptional regulator [Enterobacter roggenkampii]|uniref:Rrf2 family transcriptional regulator n=1 Tax=Enterobacter cloacae complex TaxID=354276 RepID=UPI0020034C64|nr:Rrf2 family transcriptional regulator [Enterobacter roggenkampii]MCK6925395.1 Rrf2 family transcriptional regulator [Enterobacter roggenkampii]